MLQNSTTAYFGVCQNRFFESAADRERLEALEVGEEVGAAAELRERLRLGFLAAFGCACHERGVDGRPQLRQPFDVDGVPFSAMFCTSLDARLRGIVDDLFHVPARAAAPSGCSAASRS